MIRAELTGGGVAGLAMGAAEVGFAIGAAVLVTVERGRSAAAA
jgi:hypothetical protein